MNATIARRLLISGRVQGVWYRQSTADEANRLGLAGSVANLADGRVEAVVEGPADSVAALVAWCRRGPPNALVADVVVTDEAPAGLVPPFVVRR